MALKKQLTSEYDNWREEKSVLFQQISEMKAHNEIKFDEHEQYFRRNAGINLTSYHPPGLIPGPLIFSVKIAAPGTAFQYKTPAPGRKNKTKIPTPGHNLPSSNAKRSMKKKHNSIKSSFFPNFP